MENSSVGSPEVSGTDSRLSNPFSTGGGGVTFEHLVGASYLVSLLAEDVPRGLDRGIIRSVAFQQRWSGAVLDDVVVSSRTADGQDRRLALAVKHDLTFSDAESNAVFRQVVSDCWRTFTGATEWPFDPTRDRIGIGVGEYSAAVDKHLQEVLDWARHADSAAEFSRKIEIERFSSEQMRSYVEMFRAVLAESAGREICDEELWQFLTGLVVLHFDFEHGASRDTTIAWNRLLDQLVEREEAIARQLFDRLISLVDTYARDAGTLTSASVRGMLAGDFPLHDAVSCGPDLARLREHSDRTLRGIRTTIGDKLHLPRTQLLDEALDCLGANRVLIITGEPGMGKSVLLSSLADRLRREGEVLATSVEGLSGASLEAFASDLRIQNDFQTLFAAVSSAPFRCFFIDRLEKAAFDSDRRRVLNDLIREVKRHNENVISLDGHPDSCWRIVAACRAGELDSLLPHLALREDVQHRFLQTVQVDGLTVEELNEVSEGFPRLSYLISQEHVQELLKRPFVLDFLTLPELSLSPQALPEVFTEAWLMDWYWHQVIRLADGARDGIGDPNAREQTMLRLGKHILETGQAEMSIQELDAGAVTGLALDRVVDREDTLVRPAHDILEDWAAARILGSCHDELPQFLESCEESLALVRPLRLLAVRQLEEHLSPDEWLELLSMLRGQEDLSPRWYQTVLTGPLFSPLLQDMLDAIELHLLANDGQLLTEMLQAIRTICTLPSPVLSELLAGAPQPQLDKYLANARVPVVEQWLPILSLLLKHKDQLPPKCLSEVAEVSSMWMRQPDAPIRRQIGQMCLDFLTSDRATAGLFKSAGLWAADCLPEPVEEFVYAALAANDPDLRELLLHDDSVDWIPLCQHLPKVLVDATERLLCQRRQPDRFGGLDFYWCSHHGIRHVLGWRLPPTYMKGPFLSLLRLHPAQGIELVARITDYATAVWRECTQREGGRTPVPQTVRLSDGDHEIWGDEGVYAWFRYPSLAAHGVTCALMALERWMDEQIKAGEDVTTLVETVLSSSSSSAIAGVCVSVALADWRTRAQSAMPLLEHPAFWFMDRARAVQELGAPSFVDTFIGFALEGDQNIAKRMAEAPHRRLRIDHLAYAVLLGDSDEARETLQTAMKGFPESPPLFFEEEREDAALVAKRVQVCELIAAAADPESYEFVPGEEEGTFVIQVRLPKELEARERQSRRELGELEQIYKLFGWAWEVVKEGRSEALSLQEALDLAQQFVSEDNPGVRPASHLERVRAQAIALTAAALVERNLEWARTNNCLSWCREQLLTAARRPEESPPGDIPMSRYPWGFRRSAARGLPTLLRARPRDASIRRAIRHLCAHPKYEVRALLFGGLRVLWSTDSDFVWGCLRLGVRIAVRAPSARTSTLAGRLKHSLWSLGYRTQGAIGLSVPRMLTRVPVSQIDWYALSCVLYALPLGNPDAPLELSPKHLALMDDMLALTVRLYELSQETYGDHRTQWVPVPPEWRWPLFDLVSNWVMYLPLEQAQEHFLHPIESNWEEAFGLAEDLLRAVLLAGSTPELHGRFVQVWRTLIPEMLQSPTCKNLSGRLSRELENVLGLMILHDRTGVVAWQVEFWEPVLDLIDLIDLWVEVVGHHPECLPSLVGLLQSIASRLVPEYGVKWLFTCLENATSAEQLLKRSGVSSSLAVLLHYAWYTQSDSLRADSTRWHQFVVLVDHLAARGEQVAVELQRRIQDPS